jgi:hypothetical protein
MIWGVARIYGERHRDALKLVVVTLAEQGVAQIPVEFKAAWVLAVELFSDAA